MLNITIFTFSCLKKAQEGGLVGVGVRRGGGGGLWKGPGPRLGSVFETLNLFHAYLFYDSTGHRVYTQSATSGLDNLLGINRGWMLIGLS